MRAKTIVFHATCAALAASALAACAPASSGAPDGAIELSVTLSDQARQRLSAIGETVTVSASWYGAPRAEFRDEVDEIGRLALGNRQWELPADGGRVAVAPDAAAVAGFAKVDGPVGLNVNVYSSRRSAQDNLLSCDFVDGDLPALAGNPVPIRCSMIEENAPTRHFPEDDTPGG